MRLTPAIKRMLAWMNGHLQTFVFNTRAEATSKAVEYGVAFLVVGLLFPIGIEAIYAANVTGWNASVKTMFQVLLPILAIIGIAVDYVRSK